MNKENESFLWNRLNKVSARKAIEEMFDLGMITNFNGAYSTLLKWKKQGIYDYGVSLEYGRRNKMQLVKQQKNLCLPIKQAKDLYSFGGTNVWVQKDKIKNVEVLYWDEKDSIDFIPVLLITLKDNTQICIDYNSIEDAENALKEYKKESLKRVK